MSNKPVLLYVDDEPLNLKLFAINFRNKFDVVTSESPYEGMDILKSNSQIGVVISDMKMPGMSGIEFIRQARQEFPNLVYFILTGFDITEEISSALNEGLISKYFRKPFNINEVEASINHTLNP
ncbi:MAG: response regulator [Bacteroidales bacterium]|nr:response regulator [Bacteroidales bacterium]